MFVTFEEANSSLLDSLPITVSPVLIHQVGIIHPYGHVPGRHLGGYYIGCQSSKNGPHGGRHCKKG